MTRITRTVARHELHELSRISAASFSQHRLVGNSQPFNCSTLYPGEAIGVNSCCNGREGTASLSNSGLNEDSTTISGKCGAEIPANVRQGACPACLLETGLGLLIDESVAGMACPS